MTVQRSPNASRAGVRLTVSGNDRALRNADELARRIAQAPGVVGVTPFIEADVMLASQTNISSVVLKGVDLEPWTSVIGLRDTIEHGKLEYLRQPGKDSSRSPGRAGTPAPASLGRRGPGHAPGQDTELPSSPPEPSPEAGPDQSHRHFRRGFRASRPTRPRCRPRSSLHARQPSRGLTSRGAASLR